MHNIYLMMLLQRIICPALFFILLSGCAGAQTLCFKEILEKALASSYDLKIGSLEVDITREWLIETKSMYYPAVSLNFTNEYNQDLDKSGSDTVSIGDTIISGNDSGFQHSVVLSSQYLLYDFGKRGLKYRNAQRNIDLARRNVEQKRIDLKIEILTLYSAGLRLQKKNNAWADMLKYRRQIYQLTRRLVDAGSKDKLEQGNAAILVAESIQTIETLRLEMAGILERLTYYTGQSYRLDNVRFMDLTVQTGGPETIDISKLPEVIAYDIAIEQKRAEIEIAGLHLAPTVSLFGSYNMYGNDRKSIAGSFKNLEERNAAVGLVVNMTLFNGFSDEAALRRLKIELQKLKIEKEKKMEEDKGKIRALEQKTKIFSQCLINSKDYQAILNFQVDMGKRLAGQKVLDQISLLVQFEEQLEKQLELWLADVDRRVNAIQLEMFAEGTAK